MPAKNTALFLAECMGSILAQTYTNWELLVVDDNSTDTTFSILEDYRKQDKRIHIFKNTGNGIIDALRLAYSNSKGEFVTRMDADDIMHVDKLKIMQVSLQASGKGYLATGLVKYFCDGEIGGGFKRYEEWLNSLSTLGANFEEIYNSDLYPEDYDLTFRFKEAGLKCIPTNQVLHYWRDYATRTSRTDENYADCSFIDIKLHHFLRLDYQKEMNLVVWGAGKKGKRVAELLLKEGIAFHWICDNPKKIGKDIYNQKMLPFQDLDKIENPQSIITVANIDAQQEIVNYFSVRNQVAMKDYFFFC